MKLFVDDEWDLPGRYPGDDWVCVPTMRKAQFLLAAHQGKVTHLSLDHDLGLGEHGTELTFWLSEEWFLNARDFWPTESCTIHSRNPVGRRLMRADILNPRYNPRPEIYTETLI